MRYVFWSEETGKCAVVECDNDSEAMSVAAAFEDEWHVDTVDWGDNADDARQCDAG